MDVSVLSDDELRQELSGYGVEIGPIVGESTLASIENGIKSYVRTYLST